MLGDALVPIADLGLQGTVFEEGVAVSVVYGSVLAGLGAVAYWIPKAYGRPLPDLPARRPRRARPGSAPLLASLPYYIAGFADQPGHAGVYDYDGPAELGTRSSPSATASSRSPSWRCSALLAAAAAATGRAGDDPWERPDARVDHVVAGAPRQLRRGRRP